MINTSWVGGATLWEVSEHSRLSSRPPFIAAAATPPKLDGGVKERADTEAEDAAIVNAEAETEAKARNT